MKIRTLSLLASNAFLLMLMAVPAARGQVQINSGGPAVSPFAADVDFAGGATISHANTINTGKVTNPAPVAVYQTGRDGNFTYTIPGFTAGTSYVVRLHFCETYWTAAGKREFNVTINGTRVLTNFDIFATAGGQNIANIQQFTMAANSSGQFVIQFTTVLDNSLINGIEILSAGPCTAPTAPSGLTATAASGSHVNLSWTASSSSCAVTYTIFRSTTSGFTPSSSNQIASGVNATTYSDTTVAGSTTYYYLVEGSNSGGSSGPSNQASAVTPCSAPTAPSGLTATAASTSQINLSWTASTSSCAINYNIFRSTTSGFTPSSSNQITSGVTATTYSDTGLVPSTTYYYIVEGTSTGGTSGPSNQASAMTQASGNAAQIIAINSAGPAVSPFVADEDFVGGATISHANTINTSNVINPAPAAVYQTGRDGNFTYTIGGFIPAANYIVRMHFCETYWTAAGQREFNVSINGTQVLKNFDILATAGGQNIANVQQFTMPANSSGQFVIQFTTVINNSLISGIEIDSNGPDFAFAPLPSPSTQPVSAGSQTTYTVTVSALNGFTGSVALSASGLPAGVTPSFNPASISGSGTSTLTLSTSTTTPATASTLTVTGASGTLSHSTTVTLIVTAGTNGQLAGRIVSEMTLDQDATELHGIQDANDYRVVPGISSLGIPLLNITNGPAGIGNGGPGHQGSATAMPAPIALAATWDVNMANLYGTVLGAEGLDLANGFVEGPDINIARTLQNGRTFEAYGEDPYLVGQIAVADIAGVQSQGVIAESKHFVANNQETDRGLVNEIIDERTLREIYLPAFETTVKQGNVGAVMCAYNQVTVSNGPSGSSGSGYMCQNSYLMNQILKQQWGFTGVVTSDFGAVHSTAGSANAGLDLEMPSGVYYVTSALQTAISNGQLTQATIDNSLMRRFQTMMQFKVFPNAPTFTGISATTQANDGAIARQIAEAGMVLLQNNAGVPPLETSGAILPLSVSNPNLKSIAVIGPYAGAAMTGGGGSSMVTPLYTVTPVAGIQNRVGSGVTVNYADGSNLTTAASLAAAANVAIVMVGDSETEGVDDSISLSGTQNSLVTQVVAAQPNTIVVMKSGTGMLMPWASSVPAILQAWYPGEEDGNAVAAVLFGDVNPSGKLPLTIPVSPSDPLPPADGSAPAQYPGVNQNGVACSTTTADSSCTATYSEGVFVGYRHYDQNNITPLFPFGYGLSYTTFSFQNLGINPTSFTFTNNTSQTVTVTFNVTNTGTVTGADVAQLYVGFPTAAVPVPEPPKWLKSFQKISLTSGQQGQVQLTLNLRSFAYWDINSESWLVAPGTYQIMVGDSSRNILLQGQVTIN